MAPPASDVTTLLHAWNRGDRSAFERVVELVYPEMIKTAHAYVRRNSSPVTMQTLDLVQQACIKLLAQRQTAWIDRSHYYGVTAKIMRRLLTDLSRERGSQKRGAQRLRVTLSGNEPPAAGLDYDVLALDEALDEFEQQDPRALEIVELRFFGGYTIEEIAALTGSSPATVKRDWQAAKAWLARRLDRR